MPLTAAQICTIAMQEAKAGSGYSSQAGQLLNSILSDLCQTYDFDVARKTFTFNFSTALVPSTEFPQIQAGGGPYALPTDFLRCSLNDVIWYNQGVAYPLVPVDIAEFDWQVQQAGNQSYPYIFATDVSQSPPVAVVWPGASGAYQCVVRYYSQMSDITTPETSSTVPWFPNQRYLLKQLAGMLMEITDDDRAPAFLGDGAAGAEGILRKYLNLKDDSSNRAKTVKLDRRRFNHGYQNLPNTKTIGW